MQVTGHVYVVGIIERGSMSQCLVFTCERSAEPYLRSCRRACRRQRRGTAVMVVSSISGPIKGEMRVGE